MEKPNDYRGDLIPGLKIEDFSPDVLARMVRMYCRMYQAMRRRLNRPPSALRLVRTASSGLVLKAIQVQSRS